MMKHNWVFIKATHDSGTTELHFICDNLGCNEKASFETGSRYISAHFWKCYRTLNKVVNEWDLCTGEQNTKPKPLRICYSNSCNPLYPECGCFPDTCGNNPGELSDGSGEE